MRRLTSFDEQTHSVCSQRPKQVPLLLLFDCDGWLEEDVADDAADATDLTDDGGGGAAQEVAWTRVLGVVHAVG